ncbi:MAG: Holliday junction resolvase RuvX [Pseudomonadales bacterium]
MPDNAPGASEGLVMGFDFGTRRIGIAVGQKLTGTATAVATIYARDGTPDWAEIEQIVDEWEPGLFVVGLPLNMDDTESDMSLRATKFARRLSGRFNIPYVTMDERLSSFEAAEHEADGDEIDSMAARLILETWLNS